ncbi:MAG: ATP-dependent RecD-like DNA helicase, partial [Acidobacteria bacterium]|nr:ATP-dependent RecD-like DNA helicase [Acidobacteriota bacterium]
MQTESAQNSERLSGTIERVTFHSPESGFCVLRVTVRGQRDLVTVVGSAAAVHPGEYLESTGCWINDATYGRQFRAAELRIVLPGTLEG